jgi:hypothetical protein
MEYCNMTAVFKNQVSEKNIVWGSARSHCIKKKIKREISKYRKNLKYRSKDKKNTSFFYI